MRDKVFNPSDILSRYIKYYQSFDMGRLAAETGFSVRYIQKLFLNYIGISPNSIYSVQRFNKSLELVRSAGDVPDKHSL